MPVHKDKSENGPVTEATSSVKEDVATSAPSEEGSASASDPAVVDCLMVNGLPLEIIGEGEIRKTEQLYYDVLRQSGLKQRVWVHKDAPPYEIVTAVAARHPDLYNVKKKERR